MESPPNSRWWRELSRGCSRCCAIIGGRDGTDGWKLDPGFLARDGNSYREIFLLSMKDLWIYICYVILMKGSIHRSLPMEKVSFSSVDFFLTE